MAFTNQTIAQLLERLRSEPQFELGDVVYLDDAGAAGEYVVAGLRLETDTFTETLAPEDVTDLDAAYDRAVYDGADYAKAVCCHNHRDKFARPVWEAQLVYATTRRNSVDEVAEWGWVREDRILSAMARRKQDADEKVALAK